MSWAKGLARQEEGNASLNCQGPFPLTLLPIFTSAGTFNLLALEEWS